MSDTETALVKCPTCGGVGTVAAFIDGPDKSFYDPTFPCSLCSGVGQVEAQVIKWLQIGRAHAKMRLGMREELRACAVRLGISVVDLSRMETARMNPEPVLVNDMMGVIED